MSLDKQILGQGVYTPREVARLVGIDSQNVLRWTRGSGPSDPLWKAYYQFLDEDVTELNFMDLIEVRVVAAMRHAGISLQSIRFAIKFAQEKLQINRPLVSQAFSTDGTEILMEALEDDGNLISLSKNRPGQKVFRNIISQSLKDVEYEGKTAARWRPSNFTEVIIDPTRFFGEPILDKYGVSTNMLYREFQEFNDLGYLSEIYEIPKPLLKKGIAFEQSLDNLNGKSSA